MRFETTKGVFLTANTQADAAILAAQYNMGEIARAGIPLAAALDQARREDILRAPGIGLKAYYRLQEAAAIAAELQGKPRRGGAGRGQGRKPIQQGEDTVTVSLRLTTSQRAKLAILGGASWVRKKLDSEIE